MPLYPFKCTGHCSHFGEHVFDVYRSFAEYTGKENCPTCGEPAKRIFTAPHISVDYTERVDYTGVLGQSHFTNKQELNQYLDQRGMNLHTPETTEAVKARHKETVEKFKDTGVA